MEYQYLDGEVIRFDENGFLVCYDSDGEYNSGESLAQFGLINLTEKERERLGLSDPLTAERHEAADYCFEEYDFFGIVSQTRKWVNQGDTWERRFWTSAPEIFVVKFAPNTASIIDCYDAHLIPKEAQP